MAKSSPEKLAAALRANLKRRKEASTAQDRKKSPDSAREALQKPPKKPRENSA